MVFIECINGDFPMNQRDRDKKKKARKIQSRKRVLARREEIRKSRKEEERLEKEFEDRESKYMSREEIVERLNHNMKILEQLESAIVKNNKDLDNTKPVEDNNQTQ